MTDTRESIDDAVTMREMRYEDTETIAQLTTQLGYRRSADEIAAWIARLDRGNPEQIAFVACVRGEVVAWIEVSIERRLQSEPFGFIGGLVVSERVRGRGIGRRLCERAEEWTREQGLEILRVTSRSTREGAHRFYIRDGYHEVKTSLVFEKRVGPKTERP
ncbi:GNAT family N-acetyltransferase [Occallatibacter riparius]|uniref:GNAT family N-acetyltransferase n=1 Tax=Occallatibacter riparius TaxID=1002689 RepID=A0A9J7BMT8_9BACT|nr:GNAT family N-acetyltransferase [Occallatibacter riparius]UWZ84003.1 GNAT family N-acetyltransferase [Occallatibacter riparius]